MSDVRKELEEIFSDIILCKQFFNHDDYYEEEEPLKELKEHGFDSIFIKCAGEENQGSVYYVIYEFKKNNEYFLIKFYGWCSPYEGIDYENWLFVKPVEKLIIDYEEI